MWEIVEEYFREEAKKMELLERLERRNRWKFSKTRLFWLNIWRREGWVEIGARNSQCRGGNSAWLTCRAVICWLPILVECRNASTRLTSGLFSLSGSLTAHLLLTQCLTSPTGSPAALPSPTIDSFIKYLTSIFADYLPHATLFGHSTTHLLLTYNSLTARPLRQAPRGLILEHKAPIPAESILAIVLFVSLLSARRTQRNDKTSSKSNGLPIIFRRLSSCLTLH